MKTCQTKTERHNDLIKWRGHWMTYMFIQVPTFMITLINREWLAFALSVLVILTCLTAMYRELISLDYLDYTPDDQECFT